MPLSGSSSLCPLQVGVNTIENNEKGEESRKEEEEAVVVVVIVVQEGVLEEGIREGEGGLEIRVGVP